MVSILAIIGVPGVGKSTFVRRMLTDNPKRLQRGLLRYEDHGDFYVLGLYEAGQIFGGTDKLSHTVQDDAMAFLAGADKPVLFEGDRLATSVFFRECNRIGNFRLIILRVEAALLRERRADRSFEVGKEQNETWLKGRESKVDTLAQNFFGELKYIDTEEQIALHIKELKEWLLAASPAPTKKPGRLF